MCYHIFEGVDILITKEECLTEIRRLHSIYGKVTKPILKEHGNMSYDVIRRRCGSINEAFKELNIEPSVGQRRMLPKETLIEDLKRVHDLHGYISKPIYEKDGKYNQKIVKRIFGNFSNMYEELGFNRHPSGVISTDKELIAELQRLHNEYGIVTAKHIKEYGQYSITTYMERFGSINSAYKEAGLKERQPGQSEFATWVINRIGTILKEEPELEKRFDWLRSPTTNRHLPIDGYFQKSNIAIEYNGPQHYHLNKFYHDTEYDLYHRQILDDFKYRKIRKHGIKLIVIDYREPTTIEHLTQRIRE